MSHKLHGWPAGSLFNNPPRSLTPANTEKISIVIPTLNQADTIEDTLLSIVNQDYQNFEIIVIDGGSTDKTQTILKEYRTWITHSEYGIDSCQSDAINKGFDLASGSIFAWINSDDYYLPGAFSRVMKSFQDNKNSDIIVGAGDIITKDCRFLKRINPMVLQRKNLISWLRGDGEWIMQQSCFWRSRIWKDSDGVDLELNLLMDVDLWFQFAKLGATSIIHQPIAVMRYYPEIKTVSLRENVKEETAYILARHGAYSEVRQIVKDLVKENKILSNEIERRNQKLIFRGLKRLGLEL